MTLLGEQPGIRFPGPGDATAPAPAEWRGQARDEVRLLVARPDGVVHTRFAGLADHLERGDLLVVNDVSGGAVFGSSDNAAVILAADGAVVDVPLGSKRAVAHEIWDQVVARMP